MAANFGFVVNATRTDPYKNFKFRILFGAKTVLGVSKVSALKRTTEVVKHRSGDVHSFEYKSRGNEKVINPGPHSSFSCLGSFTCARVHRRLPQRPQ